MAAQGGTYDDEEDEVDEVVEGVSIHHEIHDVHPAFQGDHLRRKTKTEEKNDKKGKTAELKNLH